MTTSLLTTLDEVAARGSYRPRFRFSDLAEGADLPGIGIPYDFVEGTPPLPGAPRIALTDAGTAAIRRWLDLKDFYTPINGTTGGQRAVLLVLASNGCGVDSDVQLRRTRSRRRALATIIPSESLSDLLLSGSNLKGLTRSEVQDRLVAIARNGDGASLGLPAVPINAQRVGQWIRHLLASSEKLVRAIAPATIPGTPRFGILQPSHWKVARRLAERSDHDPGVYEFLQRCSTRSSIRRPMPLLSPISASGLSELHALHEVQRLIGAIALSHPTSVHQTASLWSFAVPVWADPYPRGGHPTALHPFDRFEQTDPRVRIATRIPDGSIWMNEATTPEVLIEFEGDGSRLRTEAHIESALALSSRSASPITILFATTTKSHRSVMREVQRFIDSDTAARFASDWPGAMVVVRVGRASRWTEGCPLHDDADLHKILPPSRNFH